MERADGPRRLLAWLAATAALVACGGPQTVRPLARSKQVEADCFAGDHEACLAGGLAFERGRGQRLNPAHAVDLYERGCSGGHSGCCTRLGRALRDGLGVGRDEPRAAKLLGDTCRAGVQPSCVLWAEMIARGHGGLPPNPATAASLFGTACEQADAAGCTALATALIQGHGVAADPARGGALLQRFCTAGHAPACTAWGEVHEHGRLGERDLAKAQRAYGQACEAGEGLGCLRLGLLMSTASRLQDEHAARRMILQGCDLGEVQACSYAANTLRDVGGDAAMLLDVQTKGCQLGNGTLCAQLAGRCHDQAGSCTPDQAWQWMLRACRGLDAEACLQIGQLYERGGSFAGAAVDRDLDRAGYFYKRACRLGQAMGCERDRDLPMPGADGAP